MRLNDIYNESCETGLARLPDASIDIVVTSPPFNLSYAKQKGKKFNLNGYGAFNDSMPEGEYQDQQVRVLGELGRVLKPGASLYYNHKDRRKDGRTISPMEWIHRVNSLSLYQIIVVDRASSHNVDPIRLPPTTEYIYWMARSGCTPRFNAACRQWGQVWKICPHGETARIPHPAPFSLAIPLRCQMMSLGSAHDVVLDPYAGSGTTLVAASILGLPYVGYEINPDYVTVAKQRISAARAQWWKEGAEVQSGGAA